MARCFDAAAVAGDCAALGGDSSCKVCRIIGPDHDLTAVAGGYRVGVDGRAVLYGIIGGGVFAAAALICPADKGGTAAGVAGDVDGRAGSQGYGVAQHLDDAAGLTGGFAGRVQRAGVDGVAALQADDAVNIVDTLCPYYTAVVDNGIEELILGAGTHDYQTSGSGDGAPIRDAAAGRPGVDSDI